MPLLRDALKTNPNHAAVHWELGYAYRFAGMLNESVAECERALQIDPLVKVSNGSVLNTYLYLGEYDKFLASLPDVNDSAFLLFYRGFGEYYQKNSGAGRQGFRSCLRARSFPVHANRKGVSVIRLRIGMRRDWKSCAVWRTRSANAELVIPKACTRFHKLTQYWETNPPHSGHCVEALKVDSSVIRISQLIRS